MEGVLSLFPHCRDEAVLAKYFLSQWRHNKVTELLCQIHIIAAIRRSNVVVGRRV